MIMCSHLENNSLAICSLCFHLVIKWHKLGHKFEHVHYRLEFVNDCVYMCVCMLICLSTYKCMNSLVCMIGRVSAARGKVMEGML